MELRCGNGELVLTAVENSESLEPKRIDDKRLQIDFQMFLKSRLKIAMKF